MNRYRLIAGVRKSIKGNIMELMIKEGEGAEKAPRVVTKEQLLATYDKAQQLLLFLLR